MTRDKIRNLSASVLARLLQLAKVRGDDYQTLLTSYVSERFLYRLGESTLKGRFVLKGAMLLRLWSENPYRATHDLDLLGTGDGSPEAVRRDLEAICTTPVEPDGLAFAIDSIRIEPIRAEGETTGSRVTLSVFCGKADIRFQVDIGAGDRVVPSPRVHRYTTLLDGPAPEVLAYQPETVVAEKLEAIVTFGERNSRIKDFFDLRWLAENVAFDRRALTEAVAATFSRRKTPIPSDHPIGLTEEYWIAPSRPAQVRAFARRSGIEASAESGKDILRALRPFLIPVLDDLRTGWIQEAKWPPGGPWQ